MVKGGNQQSALTSALGRLVDSGQAIVSLLADASEPRLWRFHVLTNRIDPTPLPCAAVGI